LEKIDIIPVEDLAIDGYEAVTSRDRRSIYIDSRIYKHKNTNRLRFTLAHELSHILVHPFVFDAADYSDVEGWGDFLRSIGDRNLKNLERQAYKLAGYLLVPSPDLSREYVEVSETLRENGIDIRELPPESLKFIAKKIGERFGVSSQVIHRSAVRDGIWTWESLPPED
jgi:Zn-dependent peptidase ImmA (M78 family)